MGTISEVSSIIVKRSRISRSSTHLSYYNIAA